MAKAEQICRKQAKNDAYCTWLKKRAARLMRRASKSDPENAPTKRPIRGWSD